MTTINDNQNGSLGDIYRRLVKRLRRHILGVPPPKHNPVKSMQYFIQAQISRALFSIKKYWIRTYHVMPVPAPYKKYAAAGLVIFLSFVLVRPVLAQASVSDLFETLKEKIGFTYAVDSADFMFAKDTPNYRAFSGSVTDIQPHKILLERNGAAAGFTFLTAYKPEEETSQSVLGVTTPIPNSEQALLVRAEELLAVQATVSAQGRLPVPAEFILNAEERAVVASAASILAQYDHGLSESSPSGLSENGNGIVLSQEATDFALLLRLKSFKITRMSLDIDLKLSAVNRDIRALLSRPLLREEPLERVVGFTGLMAGLDIFYRLNEGGIRQQITLSSDTDIYSKFVFNLIGSGMEKDAPDKGVWIFYQRGEPVMRIPRAWAIDANGVFTNSVTTSIETMKDVGEVVVFRVSPDWLTSPARVFPITIETALEIVPELRIGGARYTIPKHLKNITPTPPNPTGLPVPSVVPIQVSTESAQHVPVATDSGLFEAASGSAQGNSVLDP